MPTVVIIPVKSFRDGKQRLAGSLETDRRSALGRAMAGHVVETVEESGLMPLIVTADAEVAEWAISLGFPSLPDPGQGLDASAAAGVEFATTSGSSWMILHADLPLLRRGDIVELEACRRDGLDPIAPSSDGGTSALGSRAEFRFSFGPGSFRRHLARLERPRVVASTGLLHDVDSPHDLDSAASHPRGRWMRGVA